MEEYLPIPQPKTFGPLGNLPLIDKDAPTQSFCKIAEELGPIYRFQAFSLSLLFVSGHELVAELCDESRFDKSIAVALHHLRALGSGGLFTSLTKDPNWKKAHNILLPAFSQQAMRGYHAMMVDIAQQLVDKWARLNPKDSIDIPDNMTRLTLDTIGLCGFNYRFNSFYREEHDPFIVSMVRALDEAMHRSTRLPIQQKLKVLTNRQFAKDIDVMSALVDQLIAERKTGGDQGETDLLARMLYAKDPETGDHLDDENIRSQIITFLIAGHETTSGLLSFAIFLLLKNPDVLKTAYEEVDHVLTESAPSYQQVLELKYIRMILHESLRLYPTAPQFALYAKEDTVIGGKYKINKGENIAILLPQLHRDKSAWGDDVEEFRPERFADPSKIPPHAYKPFGNGQRACIGMQFALHEATLVLGMILQHFELIDDTNYQLKVKQTLTLKPDMFRLRVKARDKKVKSPFESQLRSKYDHQVQPVTISGVNNRTLHVLYGSNLGVAERIAKELAQTASSYGVESKAAELNDYVGNLPTNGAVIIVTSSYNGNPTKNARKFVQWLEQADSASLKGVQYAVLGCGDRNWASTYQKVPRLIDEMLAAKGASRFSERGEADASGNFDYQVEEWKKKMWSDAIDTFRLTLIKKEKETTDKLTIRYLDKSEDKLMDGKYEVVLNDCKLIVNVSSKQLIAKADEVTFHHGDYLDVFSANSCVNINRALQRYGITHDDLVILSSANSNLRHFPLNQPIRFDYLLRHFVDLEQAATLKQLRELASFTVCPPHKRELEALLVEGVYQELVINKGITMLDLIEKFESCQMPFERFLELLPPKKPKFYLDIIVHDEMVESKP
ncbi:cytochrome P450 [Neobacillus pocheonensis]